MPAFAPFILEAAFRSLLMACAVWTAIRLFRLQTVLAQKVAWVLVLLAAAVMPLVMHSPLLAIGRGLRIPVQTSIPGGTPNRTLASTAKQAVLPPVTFHSVVSPHLKPSATRRSRRISESQADSDEALNFSTNTLAPADSFYGQGQPILLAAPATRIPTASTAGPTSPHSNASIQPSWLSWNQLPRAFFALYLGVASFLLLRALIGLTVAYRIWRRAEPATNLAITWRSMRQVRISGDLATPVTVASTILLPADCRAWDEAKLRVVLAHEQAHVRQGDFYLQLAAALHSAIFWFSPLGWWLQRKLSELGEALSDRAGLEQAENPASYAQILLEFAAKSRPNLPLAGVAMARSSNLSSRIERILNHRRLRVDFRGGRARAVAAAALVPAVLVAVIALIRVVPAVEAAQAPTPAGQSTSAAAASSSSAPGASSSSGQMNSQVTGDISGTVENDSATQKVQLSPGMASNDGTQVVVSTPVNVNTNDVVVAPMPPVHVDPIVIPPIPPVVIPPMAPVIVPNVIFPAHGFAYGYQNGEDDSFAIIHGDDSTVTLSGHPGRELDKARQKVHGDFLWFERDGKSYVVTDPAILKQSEELMKPNSDVSRQQAKLQAEMQIKQAELQKRMAELSPQLARLDDPEFRKDIAQLSEQVAKAQLDSPEMKKRLSELDAQIANAQLTSPEMERHLAKLSAELSQAQRQKMKQMAEDMSKQFNAEKMGELQEKLGDIQSEIGDMQGKIGEQMGKLGEKQGELGEQMGKIGEEMGRIGEEQGRRAEEASRKIQSLIDKALKDGKAKPVD